MAEETAKKDSAWNDIMAYWDAQDPVIQTGCPSFLKVHQLSRPSHLLLSGYRHVPVE